MIKYQDAQLIDILPDVLKNSPEVRAISYALSRQTKKIYGYAQGMRLLADIDSVPEKILDLLAIECQALYYDSSLPLETKRNIMRKALATNSKAGTAGAMNELVQNIFGSGEVEEWFDYGGTPFCFRVVLPAELGKDTPDQIKLKKIISDVKNARSKLESLVLEDKNTIVVQNSEQIMPYPVFMADDGHYASEWPYPTSGLEAESSSLDIDNSEGVTTATPDPASTIPQPTVGLSPDETTLEINSQENTTTDAMQTTDAEAAATVGFNTDVSYADINGESQTTTNAQEETDTSAPEE